MIHIARRAGAVCAGVSASWVGGMLGVLLVAPGVRLLGVRDLQRQHPEYGDSAAALEAIARAFAQDGYSDRDGRTA